MTYTGARGETARQMMRVLGFTLPQSRLHPAFNALNARHMSDQLTTPGIFELNIVNALWSQQGRRFLPEFLTTLGKYYGTGILQLDFKANPTAAVNTINQWASDMTGGRIPAILNNLSGNEQFILVNAIHFMGTWSMPFDEVQTKREAFYLLDGSPVTVDMMQQVNHFAYAPGANYQAIALPYEGRDVAMLIILPAPGQFSAVEAGLSVTWLQEIQRRFTTQNVSLLMPRFGFATPTMSLLQGLSALGMGDAFVCEQPYVADFSGMDGSRELCIGDVRHRAFIDVNEARTEAAAITAVIAVPGSAPPTATPEPVEMRIDRPFLFCIYDVDTGSMLLLGRTMNPAQR
jgi:serpin B